jgi:hypothetical protein
MQLRSALFLAGSLFFATLAVACQPSGVTPKKIEPAASSANVAPTSDKSLVDEELHADFSRLLGKYVAGGKVRYAAWLKNAEDRIALKHYIKRLSAQPPEALPETARKAYWINAYNALTLDETLDRFPLKSVNFDELKDPKAKDFWNVPASLGGRAVTLNDIENAILRPQFRDPRIHFAINCASNGCPILQPTAFDPSTLDRQLEAAALTFLNDPARGAHFDAQSGTLRASSIFKWYAEDFGDVGEFIVKYRPDLSGKVKRIEFQPYDWKLNDASEER